MSKRTGLTLLLAYLLVYIAPLGVRPAFIPDETRYGEIPREMIASGNWVTPRLDGIRYFEKPVLGYWLNAGAMRLFGETNFAIRLPSAAAAGLSALLVYAVAAAFGGGAGPLAATIHLSCFLVYGIGTFSVLDGAFTLFLTAAMTAYLFAHAAARGSRRRTAMLVAFGVCAGLAFLVKGFLAVVLPVIVIVPFLFWEKRAADLLRIPWVPLAAAFLTALPWALLIHGQEPDFWRYFFFHEHLDRFLGAQPSQHPAPFWFFIPVLLAGALPWTFLLPAAVAGLKAEGFGRPIVRYAACWSLLPLVFFSLSEGKLATYILPCFPPLALLLALGLRAYHQQSDGRMTIGGGYALAAVIGGLLVGLTALQFFGAFGVRPYAQTWKWAVVSAGLTLWAALVVGAVRRGNGSRRLLLFAAAPICFMAAVPWAMPDRILARKAPATFLLPHAAALSADTVLVSDEVTASAVCWGFKRSDVRLFRLTGELFYGLYHYPDTRYLFIKGFDELNRLIEDQRNGGGVVVVTTADRWEQWRPNLASPDVEEVGQVFVFAQYAGANRPW